MRSYTRIFHDPDKLEEMLELRKQGWNLSQLARHYGTDHTSIRHHCVKFNLLNIQIERKGEIDDLRPEDRLIPTPEEGLYYTNEYGERIFRGKSYSEIRADAALRRAKKPPVRVEIHINWKSQNGYF